MEEETDVSRKRAAPFSGEDGTRTLARQPNPNPCPSVLLLYPRVTPSTCPNLGSTTSRGVYFHTPPPTLASSPSQPPCVRDKKMKRRNEENGKDTNES